MLVRGHLEIDKLQYLQHQLADFEEILYGNTLALRTSAAFKKFKFKNQIWYMAAIFKISKCDNSTS